MKEKNKVFKKLLPPEELFWLYQELSKSIITMADAKSLDFSYDAVGNSIGLLKELGLLKYNHKENIFERTISIKLDFNNFSEIFYSRLLKNYKDTLFQISRAEIKYSEKDSKKYIKRNSVALDLSGLLMLLNGFGKILIKGNDVLIIDEKLLNFWKEKDDKIRSHSELKNQIIINEEYGHEAELAAMEFEFNLLKNMRINKIPERVSEYYVNAGYDIVSFMNEETAVPNKFIEVKSCADEKYKFYISKNELDVAEKKGNNYFLYLFNRKTGQFRIIQNPHKFFNELEEKHKWAMIPQVYEIKSLEDIF